MFAIDLRQGSFQLLFVFFLDWNTSSRLQAYRWHSVKLLNHVKPPFACMKSYLTMMLEWFVQNRFHSCLPLDSPFIESFSKFPTGPHWQEKLGYNLTKDGASTSCPIVYMLAGCKNEAPGSAAIVEGAMLQWRPGKVLFPKMDGEFKGINVNQHPKIKERLNNSKVNGWLLYGWWIVNYNSCMTRFLWIDGIRFVRHSMA